MKNCSRQHYFCWRDQRANILIVVAATGDSRSDEISSLCDHRFRLSDCGPTVDTLTTLPSNDFSKIRFTSEYSQTFVEPVTTFSRILRRSSVLTRCSGAVDILVHLFEVGAHFVSRGR